MSNNCELPIKAVFDRARYFEKYNEGLSTKDLSLLMHVASNREHTLDFVSEQLNVSLTELCSIVFSPEGMKFLQYLQLENTECDTYSHYIVPLDMNPQIE